MEIVIGSNRANCADSHFCLRETEMLSVLGSVPRTLPFAPRQTSGRKVLMSLPEHIPVNSAVRIDRDDVFLLGEVKGCWEDSPGTVLAIVELSHYYPIAVFH